MSGVTRELISQVSGIAWETLPPEVAAVARQCVLDWAGVALAGSREPAAELVAGLVRAWGGAQEATLVGRGARAPAPFAALVNGTAGHALDFDDTHLAFTGHPTAPVLPAVLALGERDHASGARVLAAFVCGVETECRLGVLLGPAHYASGWHATATLGTFGAAAACAHLLGLPPGRWAHALGLAGAQAAGVKSVFGTMTKPFHAGRAALGGVLGAELAARGFTSDPGILESHQGFAATHTTTFDPGALEGLGGRFLLPDTLFKYHAACYLTHSAIEAALRLREECGVAPGEVEAVEVLVPPGHLDVCNVPEPRTGLEGKFSLRATVAMALLGMDTAETGFTDERMADPALRSLRRRVTVVAAEGLGPTASAVVVSLRGGRRLEATADTGSPERDLRRQGERLEAKFRSLAVPLVGEERAGRVAGLVEKLETLDDVGELAEALR